MVRMGRVLSAVGTIALVLFASETTSAQSSTAPARVKVWALSPTMRIGESGDAGTEFFRITHVARLSSGQIVVANAGTHELRLFSASGEFLKNLSRKGGGPGELQHSITVHRGGDTLFVFERAPGTNQLHVFTASEGFRTRLRIRTGNAPQGVTPLARLSGGGVFVSGGGFRPVQPPPAGTVTRDSTKLGILDLGGPGTVVWLGDFPGNSWFGYASTSLPGGVGMSRHQLGPSLVTGVSGDRIWIGDSGSGAVTVFDASGKQVARVAMPVRPRPFSEAAVNRARQRALESARDAVERARYEMLYSRSVRPRRAPVFSRFVPSINGEMGVELFEEDSRARHMMVVFDRRGNPLGTVIVPADVTVHEIGRDHLVGVHTDDNGIETVVQYRLAR